MPPKSSWTNGDTGKLGVIPKVGISVLIGLVAFVVSLVLDSKVEPATLVSIGVSVFIGGVAFVIQFLVDVERRMDQVGGEVNRQVEEVRAGIDRQVEEARTDIDGRVTAAQKALTGLEGATAKHIEETRKMIATEFAKINDATQLFGAVEASAMKTDEMIQLVRNSTTIPKEPPLIFNFAEAEITRLSGYLKVLGQGGDVNYEGEDRDWLLGLTRVAVSSIDATSLTTVDAGGRGFVDGGLWSSDLGQQYLEAQREAIRRGVAIRRIFIVDRPELQNHPELTTIMREHAAIGVKVKTLQPNDIMGTRRTSLFDFIVLDGVLSYQVKPASRISQDPPTIATTTLVTDPDRVRDRIARFRDLWEAAQDFNPSTAAG